MAWVHDESDEREVPDEMIRGEEKGRTVHSVLRSYIRRGLCITIVIPSIL